jgi:hypothetical protein
VAVAPFSSPSSVLFRTSSTRMIRMCSEGSHALLWRPTYIFRPWQRMLSVLSQSLTAVLLYSARSSAFGEGAPTGSATDSTFSKCFGELWEYHRPDILMHGSDRRDMVPHACAGDFDCISTPFGSQLSTPSMGVKRGWSTGAQALPSAMPPNPVSPMQPIYYTESDGTVVASTVESTVVSVVQHPVTGNNVAEVHAVGTAQGKNFPPLTPTEDACAHKKREDVVDATARLPHNIPNDDFQTLVCFHIYFWFSLTISPCNICLISNAWHRHILLTLQCRRRWSPSTTLSMIHMNCFPAG